MRLYPEPKSRRPFEDDGEIVTSQELLEHVHALAAELDVSLWACMSCPGGYGEAVFFVAPAELRIIAITALPDTVPMYLIALHELGHHADPAQFGKVGRSRALDREVFAWRWALEHSLVDPGREGWRAIRDALRSYTHDRRFKQTPAFIELLEEAETNVRR